jgi:Protein kinase domain
MGLQSERQRDGSLYTLKHDSFLRSTAPRCASHGRSIRHDPHMSPEQAAGRTKGLTTVADIYSLGAILYELLAGQPPFRAETALETLRQVCEQEPVPPRLVAADVRRRKGASGSKLRLLTSAATVDRDLETSCLKCLGKDPQRRYGSAEMLADDLDRWHKGEPIHARPVNSAAKLWSWCRRKPAFATVLVFVILLLLVVGIGSPIAAFRINRERRQTEHLLYVANMNVAQQAWEENNVGRLRLLLEETRDSPDRGFEWYYWQRQTHLAQKTISGGMKGAISVAFSPDGQRIFGCSLEDTAAAKVWDAASRQLGEHGGDTRAERYGVRDGGGWIGKSLHRRRLHHRRGCHCQPDRQMEREQLVGAGFGDGLHCVGAGSFGQRPICGGRVLDRRRFRGQFHRQVGRERLVRSGIRVGRPGFCAGGFRYRSVRRRLFRYGGRQSAPYLARAILPPTLTIGRSGNNAVVS